MKIREIIDASLGEAKPSKSYCLKTPKNKMSNSWLSSCKSRALVTRDGKKSHKIGNSRITVGGKKIKGAKYGGPLPDYGTRKMGKKS